MIRVRLATVRRLIVLGLGSLVLGCQPGVTLGGEVTTATGEPVEGARVAVTCPDPCVSAVSDASGRFFVSSDTKCALNCQVTITRDGYQAFRAEVGRVCIPPGGGGGVCRKIWIETRLLPAGSAR